MQPAELAHVAELERSAGGQPAGRRRSSNTNRACVPRRAPPGRSAVPGHAQVKREKGLARPSATIRNLPSRSTARPACRAARCAPVLRVAIAEHGRLDLLDRHEASCPAEPQRAGTGPSRLRAVRARHRSLHALRERSRPAGRGNGRSPVSSPDTGQPRRGSARRDPDHSAVLVEHVEVGRQFLSVAGEAVRRPPLGGILHAARRSSPAA